jgi:hypothetical protein
MSVIYRSVMVRFFIIVQLINIFLAGTNMRPTCSHQLRMSFKIFVRRRSEPLFNPASYIKVTPLELASLKRSVR